MKTIRLWTWIAISFGYLLAPAQVTQQVTAIQHFFNTDPGVGEAGNGAIIAITPTADLNQEFSIALPASLGSGIHQLYIRTKDEFGRWSLVERRAFYISDVVGIDVNIKAYQYFFNTDPGVGTPGNGAIVNVTPTTDLNQTIAIPLPGSLGNGIHNLYVRIKDVNGRWSLSERRSFYISDVVGSDANINAYQYYFNTDPGVGVIGNGAVVSVSPTTDYLQTIPITLPTGMSSGIHQLYMRTRDNHGRWSMAERRMFYISNVVENTNDLTALEYYFDTDPGPGNANPYPITQTDDFDQVVDLGVPCLSTGTHYLYIRAKDTANRWSIIDRDTVNITSGIEPSVVSPAGPLTICDGSNVVLSTTAVTGVTYQWVESGVPIPGATSPSLTVNTSGSYALRTICGSFVLSNSVEVSVVPMNTYYADTDDDGYGDQVVSLLDCSPPSGYVANDDDCNDTNAAIHPNAPESCNMLDDDCDSLTDEGVATIFYADGDNDGFGNPSVFQSACTTPSGYVTNPNDCDDANALINPDAEEVCNETDDDCDGVIDDDVQSVFYADADSDGFGNPDQSLLACNAPTGYVMDGTDCDDELASVHPGAVESCNGIDDDCDNEIDEGFVQSVAASSITSSDNYFCAGLGIELNVEGGILGSGAEWTWYEGECGSGPLIGTGATITVTPSAGSHIYYVRAEGTCNTTACASVTITVYSAPSSQLCPSSYEINNDETLCTSTQTYSVAFGGNPMPSLSFEFTGATTGSGTGSGSGASFNVGETVVHITADNSCGSSSCDFTITINDDEAPVFAGCPGNISAETETGQWGGYATWDEPQATDNCEVATMYSSHQPGDFFIVGETTVTYTAIDIHGNSSDCSFVVAIEPPEVLGDVNISIFANDIQFSDPTPEPGTNLTVYATIHNYSNVDAGAFTCRLYDAYSEDYYPDVIVPALEANQSIMISWIILTPAERPLYRCR